MCQTYEILSYEASKHHSAEVNENVIWNCSGRQTDNSERNLDRNTKAQKKKLWDGAVSEGICINVEVEGIDNNLVCNERRCISKRGRRHAAARESRGGMVRIESKAERK